MILKKIAKRILKKELKEIRMQMRDLEVWIANSDYIEFNRGKINKRIKKIHKNIINL